VATSLVILSEILLSLSTLILQKGITGRLICIYVPDLLEPNFLLSNSTYDQSYQRNPVGFTSDSRFVLWLIFKQMYN